MTDKELSTLLSELKVTASKLNTESDSINSIIESVEKQIVQANVGLEVWLDDGGDQLSLINKSAYLPYNRADGAMDCEPVLRAESTVEELGFGRLEDRWAVVVRLRRITYEVSEGSDETIVDAQETKRIPLIKCSRNQRISALEKLPSLIRALKTEAEGALATIASAKKLVA